MFFSNREYCVSSYLDIFSTLIVSYKCRSSFKRVFMYNILAFSATCACVSVCLSLSLCVCMCMLPCAHQPCYCSKVSTRLPVIVMRTSMPARPHWCRGCLKTKTHLEISQHIFLFTSPTLVIDVNCHISEDEKFYTFKASHPALNKNTHRIYLSLRDYRSQQHGVSLEHSKRIRGIKSGNISEPYNKWREGFPLKISPRH